MKTITIEEDIKTSSNKFKTFTSFIENVVKNNYPDSNIENQYLVASDMKNEGVPDNFIKNFIKSYDQ